MDTQGAFDSDSTVKDCATVFALSTMLSSVLIYNLSQNIQEDDLQHLQLFTEYGRLALEDSGRTPFQKLCFLIRDWSFPYESPYGVEGGRNVLEKRLQISERQHKELQQIRKQIRSCFEELSCFLLPHPGLKVATDPKFDGKLADMEDLFVKYVGELIPSFLAPEKLTIKEIGGQKIVCKDLVQYFKSYVEIYKGGSLPEPKTMLEATAEANNLSAVSAGRDAYSGLMENVCGGNCPYLSTQDLYDEHQRIKARAIDVFKHMPKMGGEEYSEGYELKLENELEELYEKYKSQNESKNIFKAAKTPAVLMTLALVMYIAGTLFHFLGLALPSFACTLIVMCSFASLMAWAYARYTGEARQFGIYVDGIAELLWKNFMKPASEKVLDRSGGVAKIVSVGNAIKDGLNATAAVPGPGGDRKNR
jgi:atlastin